MTTDFRSLCARLVELWDADCDIDVEINELRAALAENQTRHVYNPVQIAECGGPCEQGPEHCDCGALGMTEAQAEGEVAELVSARLRHCPTHGQQPANAWGCPECVRELRNQLKAHAQDEVAELVAALRQVSDGASACDDERTSWITARAAELLQRLQPEPPTDEELAQTAMKAVESYRYNTELPYFLSEDSDEYEPFMLILRAVLARWGNS